MPNSPNNDNRGKKSQAQLGGHEVQYVLVAGLIGAILLLILLVVFIQY